ncbi:MAG: DNA-3-methyladenine glycosylase [Eubacteriales bacterium]
MKIDRSLNGVSFLSSNRIWIEDDGAKPKFKATKRIGIDYATAEYRNKLWRFVIK